MINNAINNITKTDRKHGDITVPLEKGKNTQTHDNLWLYINISM